MAFSFSSPEARKAKAGFLNRQSPQAKRPRLQPTSATPRGREISLREAAVRHRRVLITYTKKDGASGIYLVEPYSIRHKRGRVGWIKTLYGWGRNVQDAASGEKLRQFTFSSIQQVIVTNEVFSPRWPVEFK